MSKDKQNKAASRTPETVCSACKGELEGKLVVGIDGKRFCQRCAKDYAAAKFKRELDARIHASRADA